MSGAPPESREIGAKLPARRRDVAAAGAWLSASVAR
jgi:hypothetical protein